MNVCCVRSPEGWLYRDDALIVYLSAEDVAADAIEPEAEVVEAKAEAVSAQLERGKVGRGRLVLRAGDHHLLGLDQWRELVADAEERIRAEVEAQTRSFLMEAVARGEFVVSPQPMLLDLRIPAA